MFQSWFLANRREEDLNLVNFIRVLVWSCFALSSQPKEDSIFVKIKIIAKNYLLIFDLSILFEMIFMSNLKLISDDSIILLILRGNLKSWYVLLYRLRRSLRLGNNTVSSFNINLVLSYSILIRGQLGWDCL